MSEGFPPDRLGKRGSSRAARLTIRYARAMREGTGIAGGVAGAIATFFTVLAALLVGTTYLFVCIYAIVKLIGDADGHPDPATLIVGFVVIPTVLVIGLLVGIRFLGKSLISRKRPKEDPTWNA